MRCFTKRPPRASHQTAHNPPSTCDSTLRSPLGFLTYYIMAPKSLLRHVFRDLKPKIDQMRSPTKRGASPNRTPRASDEAGTNSHASETTPPAQSQPHVAGPAIPATISEESSAATTIHSHAAGDSRRSNTYAAYTTQKLLETTVFEAKMALQSHLDSLTATLSLLDALDGFSQTITVMKRDMLKAKGECEEKFEMIEEIEDEVNGREFDSE
ncbi:hypothetical protein NX059_006502 [Plenodomus lindquistii]|nr:hypothetical protein NX059_006502 [Plenodomus lindquistii]